jgi:hypothetical protein
MGRRAKQEIVAGAARGAQPGADERHRPGGRFRPGHAEPTLDVRLDLGAEAEDETSGAECLQVVGDRGDGHRVAGERHRDRGTQCQFSGPVGGQQERQERVAADLGRPDSVVAETFGGGDLVGDAGQVGPTGPVDRAADIGVNPHRLSPSFGQADL